jgi:hypothetical protein
MTKKRLRMRPEWEETVRQTGAVAIEFEPVTEQKSR